MITQNEKSTLNNKMVLGEYYSINDLEKIINRKIKSGELTMLVMNSDNLVYEHTDKKLYVRKVLC